MSARDGVILGCYDQKIKFRKEISVRKAITQTDSALGINKERAVSVGTALSERSVFAYLLFLLNSRMKAAKALAPSKGMALYTEARNPPTER